MQLEIFDRALLSLVLSQNIPQGLSGSDYTKIKDSLNDLFRITARTAYVAYGQGATGPAPSRAQAATLISVLASGVPLHYGKPSALA
jgi:hypothetical protein